MVCKNKSNFPTQLPKRKSLGLHLKVGSDVNVTAVNAEENTGDLEREMETVSWI